MQLIPSYDTATDIHVELEAALQGEGVVGSREVRILYEEQLIELIKRYVSIIEYGRCFSWF